MKLFVTGGAGFIGSCFIKYILGKYPDYKVINYDKLTYCADLAKLKDVESNPNYSFIKGDICDLNLLRESMKDVDCVVNFAAQTHVDNSIKSPDEFVETNINGVFNILKVVKEYKIQRFLQISTDEVYGSIDAGFFDEKSPLAPNSPYSATKASADMLIRAYFETYKLPVLITRCSNNYGPYQFREKLVPCFISKILKNEKVPLYGDGQNVRDWLYVDDHCSAIDKVIHFGRVGEIYNIGAHCEKTNLEITKIILNHLGKDESLIEFVEDRLGHDRRYAINNSKIKKELSWVAKMPFEIGIKKTIDWYIKSEAQK